MFKRFTYLVLFSLITLFSFSQKDIITYGMQIKPLVPFTYFVGETVVVDSNLTNTFSSKPGYSFGMMVRRGFTNTIAMEFGINYVRRNYNIFLEENDKEIDRSEFGYVSYEIPTQALFYAKLSDEFYINGAGGLSVNFYASSVGSNGENQLIRHISTKEYYVDLAILSNIGFEYRTKEKGYFYLGSSLHIPFRPIAKSYVRYDDGSENHRFYHDLNGSYLTIDFRYFFAEQSRVKKRKKKKSK